MIKRFYVNNFRCLENFELPIAEKSSALLIGKNGSGKSTISFVLEILQSIGRGTNRVGQLVKLSDFSHKDRNIPIRIEIEAVLQEQTYQYNLAFDYPERFREPRVLEEELIVDKVPRFHRQTAEKSQITAVRKGGEASFTVDWHPVALPVVQEETETDPLYIFKTWLARMLILAPVPSLITGDSEGETLLPNRQLTNLGDWFSGFLAEWPAGYTSIDRYMRQVMPDFKSINNLATGSSSRSLSVDFQKDKNGIKLPVRALSDGEKMFLICAVILAANECYGPLFCFWDEPDNFLSLDEVGHFVLALRQSFQNSGGQLIATSHNREAIRQFSDENTLLLSRRSHLEPATVRPVNELGVNGDLGNALARGDVVG